MKLWLVETGGWDREYNIVRAATVEDAMRISHAGHAGEVTELVANGEPGIVWQHIDDGPNSE